MSIDFRLFPMDAIVERVLSTTGRICPTTVLQFSNNCYTEAAQFHKIEECPTPTIKPQPFPKETTLMVPRAEGEHRAKKDDYFGKPISFVKAVQLREFVVNTTNPHHMAIKAYLDALPDETRIVLYWD